MNMSGTAHLPPFVPLQPVERNTLAKLFWCGVERYAGIPALCSNVGGRWTSRSYRDVGRQVSRLAVVLTALGITRGDHVAIKQLADDFAQYLYLPRLQNTGVLLEAIQNGVAMLTWESDTFAYAEGYDLSLIHI